MLVAAGAPRAAALTTLALPSSAVSASALGSAAGAAGRSSLLSAPPALGMLQAAALGLGIGSPAPALPEPTPRLVPAHLIPIYPRSRLPKAVRRELAAKRAELIRDETEPRWMGFALPKADAYFGRIMARLLAGSALEGRLEPVYAHLNTSAWGEPEARMLAGVLRMDPEAIAAMSSEDEVAAVAAHELAHHVRAHSERLAAVVSRHPRTGGGDMFSPARPSLAELRARWSNEYEADALSLRLLANAGYDPSAAIDALLSIRRLIDGDRRFEFHRDLHDPFHPPLEARIDYLRAVMAHEGLRPSRRRSDGLPEVYAELAARHRDGDPERISARDLYEHYSWPKTFDP